ncbi:hypothetical protein [Mesorhizobium sp. M0768]
MKGYDCSLVVDDETIDGGNQPALNTGLVIAGAAPVVLPPSVLFVF